MKVVQKDREKGTEQNQLSRYCALLLRNGLRRRFRCGFRRLRRKPQLTERGVAGLDPLHALTREQLAQLAVVRVLVV